MLRTQSFFVVVILFILINVDLSMAKGGGRGGVGRVRGGGYNYGGSSYGGGSGK